MHFAYILRSGKTGSFLKAADMKKRILLLCLLVAHALVHAQTDTGLTFIKPALLNLRPYMSIATDMEIGFPLGDFHEEIDREVLVGKGIGFYFPISGRPLEVGFRIGDLTYDKLTFSYFDNDAQYVTKTKNKVWFWQCNVRFEPSLGLAVRPYLEAGVGLQRMFSKTFSREAGFNLFPGEDEALLNDRFDRKTHLSNWGTMASGAVGVKFNFRRKHGYSHWYMQVGHRLGSLSDFYIKKDLPEVLPVSLDNLELRRSKFSTVSLKIGFVVFLLKEVNGEVK
jgi:hypothetical protein